MSKGAYPVNTYHLHGVFDRATGDLMDVSIDHGIDHDPDRGVEMPMTAVVGDGWISVDDAVPANDDVVLVVHPDGKTSTMKLAYRTEDEGEWIEATDHTTEPEILPTPTHWRQLPAWPK